MGKLTYPTCPPGGIRGFDNTVVLNGHYGHRLYQFTVLTKAAFLIGFMTSFGGYQRTGAPPTPPKSLTRNKGGTGDRRSYEKGSTG